MKRLAIFFVCLALCSPLKVSAFGGGYKEQVGAKDIETDVTNFNGVLSSADTTVQKSLETLDDASSEATHDAVTLGVASNGLSLAGQVLSLGTASTSTTGALSSTDWNTFNGKLSSLSGAVLTNQSTPQTIGETGARLAMLWATDITVTNAITGSVTGNAGTVTNGVYTTGAGTVFLAPNGSAASLTDFPTLNQNTTGSAATCTGNAGTATKLATARAINGVDFDGTQAITVPSNIAAGTNGNLMISNGTIWTSAAVPTWNQNTTGSAATLTTARTIGGVSFNGSANITVASATGGFTVSGGDLALGTSNITGSGSIGATGARMTKGWFTDLEVTNAPTLGGVAIPSISSTSTLTNKRITSRVLSAASYTTDTGTSLNIDNYDAFYVTAQAGALKFNNPTGTPTEGQKLIVRIKDNATARALTYDTQYRAMGAALPSTTVLSKTLYMGFIFNTTDTKWDLVATGQEA